MPLPRLFGRALKGGRVTQGSKLLRGKPASAACAFTAARRSSAAPKGGGALPVPPLRHEVAEALYLYHPLDEHRQDEALPQTLPSSRAGALYYEDLCPLPTSPRRSSPTPRSAVHTARAHCAMCCVHGHCTSVLHCSSGGTANAPHPGKKAPKTKAEASRMRGWYEYCGYSLRVPAVRGPVAPIF